MNDTQITILFAVLILMSAFVSAVLWTVVSACRTYRSDASSPSLVLSYLWNDRKWYASIVRYKEKWGKGKEVVMNVTSSYLLVVLARLTIGWLGFISVKRVDKKSRRKYIDLVPDDAIDYNADYLNSLYGGFRN